MVSRISSTPSSTALNKHHVTVPLIQLRRHALVFWAVQRLSSVLGLYTVGHTGHVLLELVQALICS